MIVRFLSTEQKRKNCLMRYLARNGYKVLGVEVVRVGRKYAYGKTGFPWGRGNARVSLERLYDELADRGIELI